MNSFRPAKFSCALLHLLLLVLLFPVYSFAKTGIIIAYGDSLTEGCWNYYTTSQCGMVPRPGKVSYDYENTLQTLISSNNYKYTVYNYGKGGETTEEALREPSRFTAVINDVCNREAEFILIMEGTNDLLHSLYPDDISFNLEIMIEKSIARGLIPLVATIPPDETPGHEYKEIERLNELIRELAANKAAEGKKVVLVDQYTAHVSNWSEYTNPPSCYAEFRPEDKLHPNEAGLSAIGAAWYEGLRAYLPPRTLPWLSLLLRR